MRDSLDSASSALRQQLHELRRVSPALSPLAIHARLDAIRAEAGRGGFDALEGLAHLSAQLALLPGCRVRTRACLDHAADALAAQTEAEKHAVLAAVAARLH